MVSSHELTILEFVSASVSESFVNALITSLSYLDNTCVNNSVGHAQLCIPPHNFSNPCGGIYHQCQGRPMDTNGAPAWAQLILRSFEFLHFNISDLILLWSLDHGLILCRRTYDELKEAFCGTHLDECPRGWSFPRHAAAQNESLDNQ